MLADIDQRNGELARSPTMHSVSTKLYHTKVQVTAYWLTTEELQYMFEANKVRWTNKPNIHAMPSKYPSPAGVLLAFRASDLTSCLFPPERSMRKTQDMKKQDAKYIYYFFLNLTKKMKQKIYHIIKWVWELAVKASQTQVCTWVILHLATEIQRDMHKVGMLYV